MTRKTMHHTGTTTLRRRSRTSRAAAALLGAGALTILAVPVAGTALGADTGDGRVDRVDVVVAKHDPGGCALDQQYLPHTGDAIDGWFSSCRSQQ